MSLVVLLLMVMVINILVVDGSSHCIQKFKGDGKFLTAVGQQGNKKLEFYSPFGAAVNHRSRKVYICDRQNHRIQIMNADLTFFSSFGIQGSGNGQFNYPWDIAFDSTENVYVADSFGHCIHASVHSRGKVPEKVWEVWQWWWRTELALQC